MPKSCGAHTDCHFLAGPRYPYYSVSFSYMSWHGKCPQQPISSLCDFYINPWRVRLSQWWCDATHSVCELSTDQRYKSTGLGTFLSLALQNEVRKSIREREIHHYLSVLCACSCDFSFFRPPFSKDRICLDPTALWLPLWFHCLPSLLFDGHTQTEKVGCAPYICTWEATFQCLVECIFESGSTLKWLVIMLFFSPYLQIFQYLNCRIFNF